MSANDVHLVRLSAENLTLRQRLAELVRENKQLRRAIEHRHEIRDTATIRIRGEKND